MPKVWSHRYGCRGDFDDWGRTLQDVRYSDEQLQCRILCELRLFRAVPRYELRHERHRGHFPRLMNGFGLFVVGFLFAIGAPFVLYYLIRAEHDHRETMDRDSAEQAARRDTKDHK